MCHTLVYRRFLDSPGQEKSKSVSEFCGHFRNCQNLSKFPETFRVRAMFFRPEEGKRIKENRKDNTNAI